MASADPTGRRSIMNQSLVTRYMFFYLADCILDPTKDLVSIQYQASYLYNLFILGVPYTIALLM